MILTFEKEEVTYLLYSFFIFYVNSCISNDSEKNKIKKIASKFFEKILGFGYFSFAFPENFKEEEFFDSLAKSSSEEEL